MFRILVFIGGETAESSLLSSENVLIKAMTGDSACVFIGVLWTFDVIVSLLG